MDKIKKLHPQIKSNIRYKLSAKMMQENFIYWLNLLSTSKLLNNLFENCKKMNISISAPNPFFPDNMKNSLTNSQIASANNLIPPLSPNMLSGENEKLGRRNESNMNEENTKRAKDPLSSSMLSSMKLSTIPKFYFPKVGIDIINEENTLINSVFKNSNNIRIQSFLTITKNFYNFPPLLNKMLFNKIDTKNKGFIEKEQFMNYHIQNFRGCSLTERWFNFIKSPDRKYIIRDDFKPIFQKKYSDAVIMRIFYVNDSNDDGKITLHDFKRSDLIDVITQVCEDDINNERRYFSYEHFYVIYCTFWELDNSREPEKELFINKESFSKYDSHALGMKSVNRIFDQIPRKFVSTERDMMCFEDFLWYILSEEDKTTKTSIKYWFKVVDLDDNGIITPSEMEYFYQEQIERLESSQSEIIQFSDVLCQLNDNIPPKKDFQWTLQDFLDHPRIASFVFNALLNLNKFIENELKDPFSLDEIQRRKDYTDWDKFAYNEYQILQEENAPDDEEPIIDDE